MKHLTTIALAATLSIAALCAPAFAFDNHKTYAAVSLGISDLDMNFCTSFGLTNCESDNEGTAWKALAGYQINSSFAAEIGWQDLGEVTFQDRTTTANKGHLEMYGPVLNLYGSAPLGSDISVFGKLGVYDIVTQGDVVVSGKQVIISGDHERDLTWGVGLMYNLKPTVGIRLEWEQYNTDGSSDPSVISLGGIWKVK